MERPESVVKELIENAIDSGASGISVEIREGGLSLIRVTDNGCGIAREDIPLAFLRHATSKLKDAADLFHIGTMGFRGEALASISGVSEVELITKQADKLYGCRYEISGGAEKGLSEIGAPDGTTMIVRNLFFNVPARKKFLKSASAEGARIADITEKAALSHPEISFRLSADGKNLLHTAGNGRLSDVIFTIYGREIAQNLICLPKQDLGGISVSGYIGKPVIARSRRDFEVYFVNGRYIRSSVIEKGIEDAFAPFMMLHKFPFAMLALSVDPERVDVNVHPKKMEVRFSDTNAVYQAVFAAIAGALRQTELITAISPGTKKTEAPGRGIGAENVRKEPKTEPFEQKKNAEVLLRYGRSSAPSARETAFGKEVPLSSPPQPGVKETGIPHGASGPERSALYPGVRETAENAYRAGTGSEKQAVGQTIQEGTVPSGNAEVLPAVGRESAQEKTSFSKAGQQNPERSCGKPGPDGQQTLFSSRTFLSENSVPSFRMIGQVFETYWLIEFADKLYIIDQHAAHEKVNYERTMRLLREKQLESQMIAPPIRLSLSQKEALLLSKSMDTFAELGYEIEEDGARDFLVRAVPSNLYSIASRELLLEMIDGLSEDHAARLTPDILRDRIATMSCKAAVKGNRYLSKEEMQALIGELLTLENPYACPHGRPTIISMSKYELDRKFKRIV